MTQDKPTSDLAATTNQHSQRVKRRLAWMANYEKTGINQSYDDSLVNLAFFSDCDLLTFDEAA